MKRFANQVPKYKVFTAIQQLKASWVVAALCVTVIFCSGCDMGTYNRRLKEGPSSGPPSDVESSDSENDEEQLP